MQNPYLIALLAIAALIVVSFYNNTLHLVLGMGVFCLFIWAIAYGSGYFRSTIRRRIFQMFISWLAVAFLASLIAHAILNFLEMPSTILAFGIGFLIASLLLYPLVLPSLLIMLRRPQDAVTVINHVLWLVPNNAYLIYSRGLAHHENLDYDKALEDYRTLINRALANEKDNQHLNAAYLGRARILLERGLLDAAIKDIHLALDNNPNDALNHLIYAQIQADAENYEGALDSINQAMRLATEPNFFIYITKATILTRAGNKAEALTTLDELQNLLPQDFIAVTHRMSTLMHFEDYEAALALANHEIAQSPDALVREYMRFNRGEVYRLTGDFDKAAVDFAGVHQYKTFPNAIEKQLPALAWIGMANLSFAKADYLKAEAEFQKAMQSWSEYTVALLGLAAAQYAQGNESAAKASIEAFQAKPSRYKNFKLLEKDKLFQPEIIEIIKKLAQ